MIIINRKVIFWAAGENAINVASCLKEDVVIIGIIEGNPQRWGETFLNVKITGPESISSYDFEYVVITTPNYKEIVTTLLKMQVDKTRIIIPFGELNNRQALRELFYTGELLYFVSEKKRESRDLYLSNIKYEIYGEIKKEKLILPDVRNIDETLEMLKMGYSMSRYGDGELNMILGRNYSTFQDSNPKLIERLKEILKSNCTNHLVCLPNIYGDFENRNEEHKNWFRKHLSNGGREADYSLFDMKKTYYDAFITRPYKDYVIKDGAKERFCAIKSIWDNKKLTIIEGNKTRFGVGNDLLDNAVECERILGPAVNAFSKYDEILETALKIERDRLILIAMGHTATVLAYDLAMAGYQALDIGHLDIEYEWFLRGEDKKVAIPGKYVNEVPDGRMVTDVIEDEEYKGQIKHIIVESES